MNLSELECFSKIHSLVTELVRRHSTTNEMSNSNESAVESLQQYLCESTLNAKSNGTDLSTITKQDTFTLLKACESRISKRCNDPRFSQFLHLFNELGDLTFANRLIRFLISLSAEVDPGSHPIKLIDSPSIIEPIPNPPSLNLDITYDTSTPSTPVPIHLHPPNTPPSPITVPVPDDLPAIREESAVVSDLLKILQGRDSAMLTLIRDDDHPNVFALKHSPSIPLPLLNLCLRVGELGCCFARIQLCLEQMNSSTSLFSSSLVAAVRSHIEEYTAYINIFPKLQTGPHTLRSLLLFLLEPMYSMKRICSLLENCKEERGGTLINIIYESTFTGCPKMCRIMKSFLWEVLVSLQSLLYKWLCLGEIESQHPKDFFIQQNPADNGEIWEKGYELDLDSIPDIITLRLAERILIIGKTVSFLRNVCGESKESFFSLASRFNNFSFTFDSVVDGSFECIIHELYLRQSGHLLQVLNGKFNLKRHLKGFQDYFLISRSDFIFSFLDKAKHKLDGPAKYLDKRHLKDMYLDSLGISYAKLASDEVLNRLEVKLFASTDGDVGWDVFNLDYTLTPPLDTVFPPPVITAYQSLFRFVLTIRNCEYLILDLWKLLNRYNSPAKEDFELSELFFLSHFFISSLLHFIRKLEYFISFDIFACEWEGLCEALDGCRDLEHLRTIHQRYLDLLKVGCFIAPVQKTFQSDYFKSNNLEILKEMNSMFQTLLNNIKLAEKTFKEMFSDLDRELRAKRETEERINSSGWGMSESIEQREIEREEEFMNKMNLTKQILHKQYNKFNLVVRSFVMHIYKNPIFSLKRLAISLNYNGFYRLNKFADISNISK